MPRRGFLDNASPPSLPIVSYFVFRNVVQRYHSLTQPGVTTLPTSIEEEEKRTRTRGREKKRDIIDDQMFPASGWLSRLDFLFLTSRCLLSCFSFYAVCASVETWLADFRNEARQNCSCSSFTWQAVFCHGNTPQSS